MSAAIHKSSDKSALAIIWAISLSFCLLIGFFDEGYNSFGFLSDPGSIVTILIMTAVLSTVPTITFFALVKTKMDVLQRLALSLILGLLAIVALMALLF